MARYKSVNDIIKQVAVEVGLLPINNPVASTEEAYVQLVGLLNAAGQELVELHPWQMLTRTYTIQTDSSTRNNDGIYDLPSDFNYMIDQTGWDRLNDVAVGGPLSAQDWTYLEGRDLVSSTIYASFRQWEGKIHIFPQPPPEDLHITFEYSSRNWLKDASGDEPNRDEIGEGSDIILLHPLMVTKFCKVKFLQAKGFDATAAAMEFDTVFQGQIGKDTGAPILSASGNGRGYPFLNAWYNVGDTGFGR
jgi:hypothetical protein